MSGMAKIALGRAEDAFELLNEAISLRPRDLHSADILFSMGWAHWELAHYSDALTWLQRSQALNPRLTWANAHLASTYFRVGQQQKAEAAVRDALQYWPAWTTTAAEESYPMQPSSLAALIDDLRKTGLPDQ